MAKGKFKFDPESLKWEKQDKSFKVKFLRSFLGLLMSGVVIAFVLLLISSYIIISPSIRKKIRENEVLRNELIVLTKRFLQTEKVLEDIQKRDENIYKVIMESDPNESNQEDATYDMTQVFGQMKELEEITIAKFIDHKLDSLLEYLNNDEEAFKYLANVIETKEKMLENIPSIQPVKNDDLEIIVYGFGKRIDPVYKTPAFHNGIDYGLPEGTKVFATANGKVSYQGHKRGQGKMITITHGYGFITNYAHLSRILVTNGKQVRRGDVIGLSGNTGKSMTPHLHYEVHVNGKEVNPVNFYFADFTPAQYDLMIKLSSRGGLSLD